MSKLNEPTGIANSAHEARKHKKRPRKHKPKPCTNPPAVPTGITLTFQATEALNHLRFTGKVRWTEVTTDEQGHGTHIKKYDVQLRATDTSGVPIETEDNRARIRTHLKSPPRRHQLASATNPSGSTFEFITKKDHGLSNGDSVHVRNCKPQTAYNSVAGTPWIVTTTPNSKTFRVTGGSSGVADCTNPGVAIESEEDPDKLFVITRTLPRPKKWCWQTRVRAVDKDDCEGNWSAWTPSPPLTAPFFGADPKPPAPSGLQLDFDKLEKARHARWQGRVRWNEVQNFDYPGTPADDEEDVSRYHWQVQVSKDQVVGSDNIYRAGTTKEAQDEDDNDLVRVRFHIRNKKWWFRARVRSIDRFNRRSDYTSWTSWQRPGNEAPPRPTLVTIHEGSADRVAIEWTAPLDPDDGELIHVDIDHFQVQISKQIGFGTPYRFDHRVDGERRSFKIKDADVLDVFYGRVRSVNSDGEKSSWIPATIGGNSSPGATPDGVIVGGKGEKYVVTFNKPGVVEEKHYDQLWVSPRKLKFVKCRARVGRHDGATHPNDGCPSGGSCQVNWWLHSADENSAIKIFDTDDRLKINAGTHKDTNWLSQFNVTQILENESLSVKVPLASGARHLVTQMILEPA